MKKYYSHALLYLHETISLGSGRSDRFTERFGEIYQPMMEQLGARLFAMWEATHATHPWLVASDDSGVVGFAKAAPHRS